MVINLHCDYSCLFNITVPFYLYREYVDNGTLRDFLLRNYGSNRGGDLTISAVMDDFNQTKPHPIAFARDVAEAMYFLQYHEVRLCRKFRQTQLQLQSFLY